MRILCSFPGRYGDLLWALPTVRAISQYYEGEPVDLQMGQEYEGLVPLLQAQGYIRSAWAEAGWAGDRGDLREGWEAPAIGVPHYDAVFHLGYRRWPQLPLPEEIWLTACETFAPLPPLDLRDPWIEVEPWTDYATPLVLGWTDRWFELKVGLLALLQGRVETPGEPWFHAYLLAAPGSRWAQEGDYEPTGWVEAAQRIAAARVFLGDCSALHVLAVALGIPCVVMEPEADRWNRIFWPLGMDGPEVTVVRGLDGQPTFDARHTGEALEKALGA